MSATNRGSERREADFYPTPPKATHSLMAEIAVRDNLFWGEPCVGDGSIVDASGIDPMKWLVTDISRGTDYLEDGLIGKVDAIITNPPFLLAQQFIELSLNEASFVAYLLRLNFFGSRKRKWWWQGREPTHLFTLSERPVFVYVCKGLSKQKGCGKTYPVGYKGKCECGGNVSAGTDATEYAWFVWDNLELCIRPPGMYVI